MCKEARDMPSPGSLYDYQNAGLADGAVRMNIKRRELAPNYANQGTWRCERCSAKFLAQNAGKELAS